MKLSAQWAAIQLQAGRSEDELEHLPCCSLRRWSAYSCIFSGPAGHISTLLAEKSAGGQGGVKSRRGGMCPDCVRLVRRAPEVSAAIAGFSRPQWVNPAIELYSPINLPRISFITSSVPPPIGPRRASRTARSMPYSRM